MDSKISPLDKWGGALIVLFFFFWSFKIAMFAAIAIIIVTLAVEDLRTH